MAKAALLTILRNGETIRTCPLEGAAEVVLGRGEGCVIRLEDRAISRSHASFKVVDGGVQVEKKSEFAPVMVNGAELASRAVVKEADVISIGPYLLRISVPRNQPAASAPAAAPSPSAAPALAPTENGGGATADLDPGLGMADPAAEPGEGDSDDVAAQADRPEPGVDGSLSDLPNLELGGAAAAHDEPGQAIAMDGPEAGEGGVGDALALDPLGLGQGEGQDAGSSGTAFVETADDDAKTKLTPAAKLSVHLVFPPGAANVTDFELTQDEVSIGRGKGCDIVLNDKKSSRKNAIIRRAGLSFTIKDLDSANGTFVNGARVTGPEGQELASDDVVRVGSVEFQFKAFSADYSARERNFMPVPTDAPGDPQDGAPMLDPAYAVGLGQSGGLPGPEGLPALDLGAAGAGAAGAAGLSGIPGITGIGPTDTKQMGFVEKLKNWKSLPTKDKLIVGGIILGIVYFGVIDEEVEEPVQKAKKKPAAVATAAPGVVTFASLPPEKQRFIEAQRNLAFEYFKNKEYDKSLYELEKIFAIIPEYKDARDIERFAREGKRKLEAFEEEKRKKEEEVRLKAKIQALVEECQERMDKKQYEQARELFAQISVLDPDNERIAAWKKEIEDFEEKKRLDEQTRNVQAEINKRAWEVYGEALALKKAGKFHSAIEVFGKVGDIGASDRKVTALAVRQAAACRAAIRNRRDPVLAEAKQSEEAGEFPKAFALYKRATVIDPPHPAGYKGMARIRDILHQRAKVIYTEAVLAEGYSDFGTAKKKFKECLETAPADDIYHERSLRKLGRYFKAGFKEEAGP